MSKIADKFNDKVIWPSGAASVNGESVPILTFKKDEVQGVIDYTKANPILHRSGAKGWRIPYEDKLSKAPTLQMVGDDGVYIMTGGATPENTKKGESPDWPVAYATACNPKTCDFDSWWGAKQDTWGGDDGCVALNLREIEDIIKHTKMDVIFCRFFQNGDIQLTT